METDQEPRILVVEDEVLLRWFLRDILEDAGFNVEEADNAERAMGMLEDEGYEAVVTDIEMPGEFNGVDLAWAVEVNWPNTGVVITSGKTLPPRETIPSRAKFLAKPLQVDSLVRAVEDAVAGSAS